jgi:hypothetical protein
VYPCFCSFLVRLTACGSSDQGTFFRSTLPHSFNAILHRVAHREIDTALSLINREFCRCQIVER